MNKNYSHFVLFVCILMIQYTTPFAQANNNSNANMIETGDTGRIAALLHNGIAIKKDRIVAWFPQNELSQEKMHCIVDTLNKGVKAVASFIHAPQPWQLHLPDQPITFYFCRDSFVSHASSTGYVAIPFWRIKEGKAPWLHESVHEMLVSKHGSWFSDSMQQFIPEDKWMKQVPIWLHEGLADYITMVVSTKEKLFLFDIFNYGNISSIDSACIKKLQNTSDRDYILSFIGNGGQVPELRSAKRNVYAPVFYNCACSFVKFIAEKYDIAMLLAGIAAFGKERATIEQLAGESMESMKKEWMGRLAMR